MKERKKQSSQSNSSSERTPLSNLPFSPASTLHRDDVNDANAVRPVVT